jgi:integrase
LAKLGGSRGGQLDSVGSPGRLSTRIRGGTSSSFNSFFLKDSSKEGILASVGLGGSEFGGQAGSLCDPASCVTRFLQPHFLSSQEGYRKVQISNQSKTSEQDVTSKEVQNGNVKVNRQCAATGRLDSLTRPKRRLFPRAHPQGIEKISQIRARWEGLRVSVASVWSRNRALRVHKSASGLGTSSTQTTPKVVSVSGRLAPESDCERSVGEPDVDVGASDRFSGLHQKRGEVCTRPHSAIHISGRVLRLSSGYSPYSGRALVENAGMDPRSPVKGVQSSKRVVQGTGSFDLSPGLGSAGKAAVATASDSPKQSLVRQKYSGDVDPSVRVVQSPAPLVASGETGENGRLNQAVLTVGSDFYRRLKYGLGGSHRRFDVVRQVVPSRADSAYQLSRDASSHQSCPRGNRDIAGTTGAVGLGQHNCSGLHKQAGGHTLPYSVSVDGGAPVVSLSQQCRTASSPHSRFSERSGGLAEQETSDSGHRVESTSGCSQTANFGLGCSRDRFVCHSFQSQVPPVCVPSSGRQSRRSGRDVCGVERPDSLCVSSNGTGSPGPSQTARLDGENASDCSGLADKVMVPGNNRAIGGLPVGDSYMGQVAQTAQKVDFPPEPSNVPPTRLASVRGTLQQAGFSEEAALRISEHNRPSTNKLYQCRWGAFGRWCAERGTDPLQASVSVIADFLLSLFHKGLQPTSIRGYRTAISNTLKHQGMDVGADRQLGALLSNLQRECPRPVQSMPSWDLALVLRSLTRHPYEPLKKASDKFLTFKTVFLVALATGCRVSEIHALDVSTIRHTEGHRELHISPNLRFLSKTQRALDTQRQLAVVKIKALAPSLQEDMVEDRSLCPVRAVRYYLDRTSCHRRDQNRLFVSYISMHKEITKITISYWIKKVIQYAYTNWSSEDQSVLRFKAHDVRALAGSWAFRNSVPLVDIMQACSWKRHSTFSEFYLKDMATQAADLYHLGPLVVAQHLV